MSLYRSGSPIAPVIQIRATLKHDILNACRSTWSIGAKLANAAVEWYSWRRRLRQSAARRMVNLLQLVSRVCSLACRHCCKLSVYVSRILRLKKHGGIPGSEVDCLA